MKNLSQTNNCQTQRIDVLVHFHFFKFIPIKGPKSKDTYSSFLARPEVTDFQQDSYSEVLGGKVILAQKYTETNV